MLYYTYSVSDQVVFGLWAKQEMKPTTYNTLLEIHKLQNYLIFLF